MRYSTLAVFLVLASTASASPRNVKRIVTTVPRAFARTAENMVTFKDRSLAIHQWILVAAVMANAGSEIDLYSRCQNCHELNTLVYGLHPSAPRIVSEELVGAICYSTVQQIAWELSYERPPSKWHLLERWVPTFAPALSYSLASYRNTTIPSDGSRVVRFWQFP